MQRGLLKDAARASDSYGLLLGLLVIDYVLLSVGWEGGAQTVILTAFIAATALLGLHTSGVRGPVLRVVRITVALGVVASIVAAATGGQHGRGIVFIVVSLLVLATPIAVLTRIVKHRQVTAETLLGAICTYILIGLLFAYGDLAVQLLSGHFFAQTHAGSESDFVYYSFITMTTVGYGDLTPTTGFPRTMAVTEALVGQIFLVVLVSRLVAMYVPRPFDQRRQSLLASGSSEGSSVTESDGTDADVSHP